MARARPQRLYDANGDPRPGFNLAVLRWLREEERVAEHSPPAAFGGLRRHYDIRLERLLTTGMSGDRVKAHRELLSDLTAVMNECDLTGELTARLDNTLINDGGARSALSQGVMKNSGENFVNAIVYALADLLKDQDEVLVDKGLPPRLRAPLTMIREFVGTVEARDLELVVESDLCIFTRADPFDALVCSAKTRLKEVFHVGTMWKLFFDMINDDYCKQKWGVRATCNTSRMQYVFATADNIREGGKNSQGPDLKPEGVRNLLALDASFFDYVFVSKKGLDYVSPTLASSNARERLFHELGCMIDLVRSKYPRLRL